MYKTPDGRLVLEGDGTWPTSANPLHAIVNQEKGTLDVGFGQKVVMTWFGGDSDPEDNGETACGYPTKGHPDLMGAALPMVGYGVASLDGSAIPHMPFGLTSEGTPNAGGASVEIMNPVNGQSVIVPVIDLGPARQATSNAAEIHGLDATVAVWKALGLDIDVGVAQVTYSIIGGAKYVPGLGATP